MTPRQPEQEWTFFLNPEHSSIILNLLNKLVIFFYKLPKKLTFFFPHTVAYDHVIIDKQGVLLIVGVFD